MKKHFLLFLVFVGLLTTLFSFQNGINKASHAALEKRLKFYREKRMKKCNEEAMKEVLVIVDSMLIKRAQVIKTAPITKPPIPPKPTEPEVVLPDDQTPIAPIIKN